MLNIKSIKFRWLALYLALTAAAVGTPNIGCVGGNFNAIRTIAKWNLSFSILPRIIVYILLIIIPVYPIAGFLDIVIFNTIEFWTNSNPIHASNSVFEKDGIKVAITNTADPLRKTVMLLTYPDGKIQEIRMEETELHAIRVFVDGVEKHELAAMGDNEVKMDEKTLDLKHIIETTNPVVADAYLKTN